MIYLYISIQHGRFLYADITLKIHLIITQKMGRFTFYNRKFNITSIKAKMLFMVRYKYIQFIVLFFFKFG